ncbi:MAG TPA: DUF4407 domain-containing protein [Solirubrobacterales bacterium]|nr:DUF4407 domain-containing protein [Solirubrobacterales bacterium]
MESTRGGKRTNEKPSRARFRIAWFAGIYLRILEKAPAEIGFYNALGAMVILISCASGVAAALAAGYMLQTSAGEVWWVGAGWALILAFGVERLILQVTANRRLWLLVVLVPRVVLSLCLAVLLAEPLVLRIHEGEINDYLSEQRVEATRVAEGEAREFYGPEIKAETDKLVAIGEQRTRLARRIAGADDPIVAAGYAERLAEVKALNRERVPRIEGELSRLRSERNDQIQEREGEISGGSGLAAREHALAVIASEKQEVAIGIWVLRIFFLCLDLLPIGAKVARILTVDSPYEAQAAAERRRDGMPAKRLEAAAKVEETQIEEMMRIDIEVGRAEANVYGANRMREMDEDADASAGPGADPGPGPDSGPDQNPPPEGPAPEQPQKAEAPVAALSLSRMVAGMEAHESRPVPVPDGLRRGALAGLASITAVVALLVSRSLALGQAAAGIWPVAVLLALVLGLMAYTHGFRTAPAWALRGTLATFYAGIFLPVVVTVVNL